MRKKLFAILMSAMMMVTFMPAMAFAAFTPEQEAKLVVGYNSDYTAYEMTYNGGEKLSLPTEKVMYSKSGRIGVFVDTVAANTVIDAAQSYSEAERENLKAAVPTGEVQYYDLTGATMALDSGTFATSLGWEAAQDAFTSDGKGGFFYAANNEAVVLKQPADVKYYGADRSAAKKAGVVTGKTVKTNKLVQNKSPETTWTLDFVVTGWKKDEVGAQTATVTPSLSGAVTSNNIPLVGTIAPATIKVSAKTLTEADINFYYDSVADANKITDFAGTAPSFSKNLNKTYDGASHKIVTNVVDGYTVTYKKWNTKTAAYDAVDAIEWKDAKTADGIYVATITKNSTSKAVKTVTFTLGVAPASISLDLVEGYVFEGEKYDLFDFVEIKGATKAVKADKAAIKAALATKYVIDAKQAPAAELYYNNTYEVVEKYHLSVKLAKTDWTEADQAAFEKALGNYTIEHTGFPRLEANLYIVAGKYNTVEIYNMTKTLKAKSLKKAKKSFEIKAEADSNTAITFKKVAGSSKLSVKGAKVVVKKGTKKGTYKIKVKATAAAGNGYAKATTTKVIKVKVK